MASGSKLIDIIGHPNFLTLFRMATAPVIVLLLLKNPPGPVVAFIAGIMFSIAAITDYLDGYLARRKGLVSKLGKIMDPLADKLLVSCSLIMMVAQGWIPGWIVCIIIGRELAITGLRNVISDGGGDVSASNLGKYKTGFQIAAIIPLLLHYTYFDAIRMHVVGMFFLWGALILTIWSGADYVIKYRKLIRL